MKPSFTDWGGNGKERASGVIAVVAFLLIWALIATGIAFQQYREVLKLEKEMAKLKWQVYSNKTVIENLRSEKASLEDKVEQLEGENWKLMQQISELKTENEKLRDNLSRMYVKVAELEEKLKLYEQIPHGYYSTNFFPNHRNTLNDLKKFLSKEFFVPHKYEKNVFDCSEISAYTEWALEDAGFDAYIVLGKVNFYGRLEDHTWNMVKVEGSTYYIDASSGKPYLFKSDSRYLKVIKVFKNIYEAVGFYHSVNEFDWWNVVGFPPKTFKF